MAIGDVIDLHTFAPRDVPGLIPDYIDECAQEGFRQVRIIHGKGKGVLREIVHKALAAHPAVESFRLADDASSWGATIVILKST
jgi:dsDNA-specific endonuclease/ATPase MutS2